MSEARATNDGIQNAHSGGNTHRDRPAEPCESLTAPCWYQLRGVIALTNQMAQMLLLAVAMPFSGDDTKTIEDTTDQKTHGDTWYQELTNTLIQVVWVGFFYT